MRRGCAGGDGDVGVIGQGVALVLQAVQNGFAEFAGNLELWVPQIFAGWSSDEQQQITQYWQSHKNAVYFALAYTMQPELMPSCVVSMEPGQEEPNADSFGMLQGMSTAQDGTVQQWLGMTVQDRFDVTLRHAVNQKLLLWLDIITWWALMRQRQQLIASGFGQQVLARSGLEPDPWYQTAGSQPVFRRIVSLTVRHQVGYWQPVPAVTKITSTVAPQT